MVNLFIFRGSPTCVQIAPLHSLPLFKNEAFACPFKERPSTIIKVKTRAKENAQNSSASWFGSCFVTVENSLPSLPMTWVTV